MARAWVVLEFDWQKNEWIYENLQYMLTKISASEIVFVCGDFNGHIGESPDVYERVHGGRGFGRHNLEDETEFMNLLSLTT